MVRKHQRRLCGGSGDSGRRGDCLWTNLENWLEIVRFAILVLILGLNAPSVAISLSELYLQNGVDQGSLLLTQRLFEP